jgi:hypothetical protein
MFARNRTLTRSVQLFVVLSILLTSGTTPVVAARVETAAAVETVAAEEPPERESFVRGVGRERRDVRLYATCAPVVAEPGGEVTCRVTVLNDGLADLAGLVLSARLPLWVAVAGERAEVELAVEVCALVTGPRAFVVELTDGSGQELATTTALLGVGRGQGAQQIGERGGCFEGEDGRLSVVFPTGALTGTVEVTASVAAQRAAHEGGRFRGGSLLRFDLDARDVRSGEAVHTFAAPVTLEVDVRGLVDGSALPAGWHLYLATVVDEATGEAEMVEAEYDAERGVVVAEVSHFSTWDLGTIGEGWKPMLTPPVPDLFSGAATYSFPVEVPPGRKGLTPSVALSYNSRRVDGLIDGGGADAGPVALGWSLGASEVEISRRNAIVGANQQDPDSGQLTLYADFAGAERDEPRAGAGGRRVVRAVPGARGAGVVRGAAERELRERQLERDDGLLGGTNGGWNRVPAWVPGPVAGDGEPERDHVRQLVRAGQRQVRGDPLPGGSDHGHDGKRDRVQLPGKGDRPGAVDGQGGALDGDRDTVQ